MIKTSCLVLFRISQSYAFFVKLESSWCRSYYASRPGSIDQSLGWIDRISGQMRFSAEVQLSPSSLKRFRVLCFALSI